MKKEKFFGWLKVSNRPKHLKAGAVIFVGMVIMQTLLYGIAENGIAMSQALANRLIVVSDFNALAATFLCMCSVEYIQKQSGGKFDWLDILAGCLIPLAMTVVMLLIMLIVC